MLTPDSVARILEAGSNARVKGLSPDSCIRLATIAKRKGVHLTIAAGLTPDSCVRIAEAGGKNVTFDLASD